ncbi:amidase family protein [Colletotrichum incanum]|uniref:Amidase family protein n=1 Tax=Colletotrichum incanum TaxID=1573173 RepID=A0A167DW26_COLIC|nr:amidase family protein [Colletotrichum incanum]
MGVLPSLDITQATISELLYALSTTKLTSVDLAACFLHRIGKLDHRGPSLNSICILNPHIFDEAQASDDHRASGRPPRALEGIPFTVKDSYQVKGLTVAAASPAFENLVASSDAAVDKLLRASGAFRIRIIIRFWRSHGGFFAPIGFGGETVSSGRAPASHNALVGYSPSRGVIPSRGHWPLYPTCDVVAPHAKSVADMLALLNVVVSDDAHPKGDFWREQTVVPIPLSSKVRPKDFLSLMDTNALRGKHIARPMCFIGKQASSGYSAVCSEATRRLWEQARVDLEALGAKITETDFPLVENYSKQLFPGQAANVDGITSTWIDIERCQMIATAWDDFLRYDNDPRCCRLEAVDHRQINPDFAPMDDRSEHTEQQNHVRYAEMIEFIRHRPCSVYELPGCAEALVALEDARKRDLNHWMDANGFDAVVFPTNGDVGRADSECDRDAMVDALQDGVRYSNGNRALKHLGVPAITVPMGMLPEKKIPVGLTFAGKAWSGSELFRYAYAYETATRRRESPPLVPSLDTDIIRAEPPGTLKGTETPKLIVTQLDVDTLSTEGLEARKVAI